MGDWGLKPTLCALDVPAWLCLVILQKAPGCVGAPGLGSGTLAAPVSSPGAAPWGDATESSGDTFLATYQWATEGTRYQGGQSCRLRSRVEHERCGLEVEGGSWSGEGEEAISCHAN